MDIVEIARTLNEEHTALVEAQHEQYDHSRLWASDFGHPCDARQVIIREHWREDVREASSFGKFRTFQQWWARQRYQELGYEILQYEPRFHNPELQLSGKPDFILKIDDRRVTNDVKTNYQGVPATLEQVRAAPPGSWHNKLYIQQQVVMMLSGIYETLVTWISLNDGDCEFCPVPYDPDIATMINARSLALNVALVEYREDGRLPPLRWLPDICPTCPWQGRCLVARTLTDEQTPAAGGDELRQLCEERERHAEAAKLYNKAHKAARDAVLATGKDLIWLDDWEINVNTQHRDEHVVPEKDIRVVNFRRK